MKKSVLLVFALAIGLALLWRFTFHEFTDAKYFIQAIKISAPEGFRFPLLYYLTLPVYNILGDAAFLVLPLLFYLGGIAFLSKLFFEKKVSQYWLAFCLVASYFAIWFISQYTRDSLVFFLSCAFTYFFFKTQQKNEYFWVCCAIAFVSFFARPQTLFFVPFLCYLFWKTRVFATFFDAKIKSFLFGYPGRELTL